MDISTHRTTSTAPRSIEPNEDLCFSSGTPVAAANFYVTRVSSFPPDSSLSEGTELASRFLLSAVRSINMHSLQTSEEHDNNHGGDSSHNLSNGTVSAVYKWYEIDSDFHTKRREESHTAHCKLCKQQGKQLRKSVVRFSKSVTSNLWRHLKENHPEVYAKHAKEKKTIQMHRIVSAKRNRRKRKTDNKDEQNVFDLESESNCNSNSVLVEAERNNGSGIKRMKGNDHGLHPRNLYHDYATTLASSDSNGILKDSNHVNRLPTSGDSPLFHSQAHLDHLGRISEAITRFCLCEMVPLNVIRASSFCDMLVECLAPQITCTTEIFSTIDDRNSSFLTCLQQNLYQHIAEYSRKINEQATLDCKLNKVVHLVLTECPFGGNSKKDRYHTEDSFLALFAIGLDQNFILFRRCVRVLQLHNVKGIKSANGSNHAAEHAASEIITAVDQMNLASDNACPQLLFANLQTQSEVVKSLCKNEHVTLVSTITSALQRTVLMSLYGLTYDEEEYERRCDEGLMFLVPFHDVEYRFDTSEHTDHFPGIGSVGDAKHANNTMNGEVLKLTKKLIKLLTEIQSCTEARVHLGNVASVDVKHILNHKIDDVAPTLENLPQIAVIITKLAPSIMESDPVLKSLFRDSKTEKAVMDWCLSEQEWSLTFYLNSILKPFHDSVMKMKAEKFVVSSLLIPTIYTIIEKVENVELVKVEWMALGSSHTNSFPEEFVSELIAFKDLLNRNLRNMFGFFFRVPTVEWSSMRRHSFNTFWVATLLDPRTRPFIVKGPLPAHEFWDLVKTQATDLVLTLKAKANDGDMLMTITENQSSEVDDISQDQDTHQRESKPHREISGASVMEDNDPDTLKSLMDGMWDDALQATLTTRDEGTLGTGVSKSSNGQNPSSIEIAKSSNLLEVEISYYKEVNYLSLRDNPLAMWGQMRWEYPLLAKLARYVLSIPNDCTLGDILNQNGDTDSSRATHMYTPASLHQWRDSLAKNNTDQAGSMDTNDFEQFLCASFNSRLLDKGEAAPDSASKSNKQQPWMSV
uniref:Uncharacterized protein AlNc14C187G8359 n=1 Tax=Albugo laibachii Nc14 TaxID=890382 RepID=F0WPL4_9STRA|nr:conserved hypothetical protein [Albugo laibachii Nc14]|eukprot:CCA23264.1 conserved hypothetical protein [Albugo laibachii Nc14]